MANPEDKHRAFSLRLGRNTSISLGDHFRRTHQYPVASGRYVSTNELIRTGLRMLEPHESQVRALQETLKSGEDSGAAASFDNASFLERMRAPLAGYL
ncbi:MAG: type II toxin-antitoxin system ParD family antitoxin [Burkholderiaceae bacterium]|nr:MAG: type II toxin-antitoxin system ParD family antitoxin [Burkholderiaceae bacterium]TAM06671.1 MAG: type II toxin-antitoxin system ParD family antitoxin [Pusillimonas sp.]